MNNKTPKSSQTQKTFLGNISITWRIGFLIGLGLLAMIATAFFTTVGNKNLEASIARENAFIEIEVAVLKADAGALMLRRREKDFLIRKDLKYWDKYVNDHSSTVAELNAVKAIPEAALVVASIDEIINKLSEHKIQFKAAVDMTVELGLNEKEGLQGQLRKAVHEVETKLKEAKLDNLTVKMLMMRRHEKDFILRGTEKYLGRIVKRHEEFNTLLKTSELSGKDQNQITDLMESYQQSIKKFGATSMNLVPEIKNLSAIYKDMTPSVIILKDFARTGLIDAKANAILSTQSTQRLINFTSIAAGLTLLILGFIVMRSLTSSLRDITTATTKLAEGDMLVEIPATENKDEVGKMARALIIFKTELAKAEEQRNEQKLIEERNTSERRAERAQLAKQFEEKVGTIVQTVSSAASEMQSSAQGMSASSEHTTSKANTVASAAEMASTNVQTVATATEELSSSISEISHQVTQSSRVASGAVNEAERTNNQVRGLAQAADKIGEVISLISDIAEQTNLLALNATIEAARAGEAGKGFAVVASEVKNLANQTATATEEISTQVAGIQTATHEAVDAIGGISSTIGQINEIASAIAAAVEEQSAATGEISRNVQQASMGTKEVTLNIGGVTEAATINSKNVGTFLNASGELTKQADLLSNEVNQFLTEIKNT